MDGVENILRVKIARFERGKIFFAQDFTTIGSPESVRLALSLLTNERFIVRLARGVYCYPKIVGEYGIRTILPDPETIAYAIAQKNRVRIVPYGEQAAYLLGFTTLQMGKHTYLTDGAPRRIGLGRQGVITFRHTSEMRIFSFLNKKMQMLSLALRMLTPENITPEIKALAAEHLMTIPQEEIQHDIKLCPVWVAELLMEL